MTDLQTKISSAQPITTIERLESFYGDAHPQSLSKEIDYISAEYRVFVEKSPFVLVATSGPTGIDCSPRGDAPGFIHIVDEKTLIMPDRRGNNRLDTLKNLIHDDRISLLFLVPGVGETLRIKGRAKIVVAPDLCAEFTVQGKVPATLVVISVECVYFQCPKALVRSKLWDVKTQVARSELPSAGAILQAISQNGFDGDAYDRAYPERLKQTIY